MIKELYSYLESIKDITAEDKEHSYRASLESLLNGIKNHLNFNKVNIKHEPKMIRRAEEHLIF